MKKLILVLTLINCVSFPLAQNLHEVTQILSQADINSKEMFACKTTFKESEINLVTTISLLSSQIDDLLRKYNETKEIKYVYLCCILRDIRTLASNVLEVIKDRKKYGFTRFTWRLNKACDKKLACKICIAFKALASRLNGEDETKNLGVILDMLDAITLPGKIQLFKMIKYMRKIDK